MFLLVVAGGCALPEPEPLVLVAAEHGIDVPLERFRCGDQLAVVELGPTLRVSGRPADRVVVAGCDAVLIVAEADVPAADLLELARFVRAEVWLQVADPEPGLAEGTGLTSIDLSHATTAADVVGAVDAASAQGPCVDVWGTPPPPASVPPPAPGPPRALDPLAHVAALPVHVGVEAARSRSSWTVGDSTCTVPPSAEELAADEAARREEMKRAVAEKSRQLLDLIGRSGAGAGAGDLWSDDTDVGDIDKVFRDVAPLPAPEPERTSGGAAGDIGTIGPVPR